MWERSSARYAQICEQTPLIHQTTNYVVMNETANATLALGALPVMAHAIEEVEEMSDPRAHEYSTLVPCRRTGSRRCSLQDWIEQARRAGRLRSSWGGSDTVPHRNGNADSRRGGRRCASRQPGQGWSTRGCLD